jgi:hypothetical protein
VPAPGDVVAALARAAREVVTAVQRGRVTPAVRARLQAIAPRIHQQRDQRLAHSTRNACWLPAGGIGRWASRIC